jgi:hypothetical protein
VRSGVPELGIEILMSATNQCTKSLATGWMSTNASAKDLVPSGVPSHSNGAETLSTLFPYF